MKARAKPKYTFSQAVWLPDRCPVSAHLQQSANKFAGLSQILCLQFPGSRAGKSVSSPVQAKASGVKGPHSYNIHGWGGRAETIRGKKKL